MHRTTHLQNILQEGNTTIFVAKENTVVGYLSLSDQVRPQVPQAVANAQKKYRCYIISGRQ